MTETTQQNSTPLVMIQPADLVVSGIRDLTDDLRKTAEQPNFLSHRPDNLPDLILSFVYQCKKMKPEELAKCTRGSAREALKTSIDIGIPVDARGLAYLTRYGNELTYHIGYKGLVYKVKQLRPGAVVIPVLVFKEDTFSYESDSGTANYTYKPGKPLRDDFENAIGGFCYISYFKNGREYSSVTPVSKSEIDEARKASKAGAYGPWKNWTGEMMKKVVVRRACKIEFIGEPEMEAVLNMDNNDYDFSQPTAAERAKDVNYAQVQPLDTPATTGEETVIEAETAVGGTDGGEDTENW